MIFLISLTIETETLWVQPADPRMYGGDQVTGGALIAWTPDLSRWMASMTVVKGFKMKSAIMAPGFLSEWFVGGIGNAGAFLEDGTPLYMGVRENNKAYVGAGDALFGPYGVGAMAFAVSPDGKHWAKVMGKGKGFVLVADGKEACGPYDYIWPVFFDSLSRLYYRFTDGDSCGLVRDGKLLFKYQWIGVEMFLRGDTVFCDVGKDGKWKGSDWKGSEALARNGDLISNWSKALYLLGLPGGKPAFLYEDKAGDWLAIGDTMFGPYPEIMYAVKGPDGKIYYSVAEKGGAVIYENGKALTESGTKVVFSVFLDDSLLGYSPSACSTGIAYTETGMDGKSRVVFREKAYGPYAALSVSSPVVSLDGKHLAWIVRQGDTERVYLDGKAQQGFAEILELGNPRFSPDGKHLVYLARDRMGVWAVLDGSAVAGPFADPSLTGKLGTTVSDIYITDKEMAVMGTSWKEGGLARVLRVRVRF
jgi:hypothetical protein